MLSFLFTVLLVTLLLKGLMFFYRIHKTTKHYRKQYEDMMGGSGQQSGSRQQQSSQSGQSRYSSSERQDSKRYSSSDGEYVDFVEIKGDRPQHEESTNQNDNRNYDSEDYITDVKFEEIIDK